MKSSFFFLPTIHLLTSVSIIETLFYARLKEANNNAEKLKRYGFLAFQENTRKSL